ncbi:hypothetical protein O7606_20080 [Micromonospora sp. WMMD882]|uniref:hypothetical protein n=1 Tax=Micromonospora sp. WMMD882 TaxID=3015151 RepID=UPI00248ACD92|nr:hypothetical protein [Micromonospora sp. WMMD882]WBB78506.1 hypothetical protein O7606_20080 [Micromonospora sp. WMMD882]
MSTGTPVDWAALAPQLVDAAQDRLRPTGLLPAVDLDAWDCLLDPADEAWPGHRADLFRLSARSVRLGVRP